MDTLLTEYNAAGAAAAFWPWSGTVGTIGQVGRIVAGAIGGVTMARAMVLTATAGTTAIGNPTTFTATLSILAPNMNVGMVFAPRLRTVPIRLQCFPNVSGILFAVP